LSAESIVLAVIGGTGLYRLASLQDEQALEGDTIYGEPSAPVRVGRLGGARVAFLARHGEGHSVPPHQVNYRANLQRLRDLGVQRVLAINTVGGISAGFGPRTVAVPDQLIDYTWGR
jgi:5'-methylthioinosine phosphorylase